MVRLEVPDFPAITGHALKIGRAVGKDPDMRAVIDPLASLVLGVNEIPIFNPFKGGVNVIFVHVFGFSSREVEEIELLLRHLEDEVEEIPGLAVSKAEAQIIDSDVLGEGGLAVIASGVYNPVDSAMVRLGNDRVQDLLLVGEGGILNNLDIGELQHLFGIGRPRAIFAGIGLHTILLESLLTRGGTRTELDPREIVIERFGKGLGTLLALQIHIALIMPVFMGTFGRIIFDFSHFELVDKLLGMRSEHGMEVLALRFEEDQGDVLGDGPTHRQDPDTRRLIAYTGHTKRIAHSEVL